MNIYHWLAGFVAWALGASLIFKPGIVLSFALGVAGGVVYATLSYQAMRLERAR